MNEPALATRATRAEASARRPRHRASPTKQAMPSPDPASERIIVIEFLWRGAGGVQPVLYLDRSYLH